MIAAVGWCLNIADKWLRVAMKGDLDERLARAEEEREVWGPGELKRPPGEHCPFNEHRSWCLRCSESCYVIDGCYCCRRSEG